MITGLAGEPSYLLVSRYNREIDGDVVRRLHQEIFARPWAVRQPRNTSTTDPACGAPFWPKVRDGARPYDGA
jgi:hypothetical protein